MGIFDFFGSILGYLLWFLYTIFRNYGIAILLFTIILKVAMFPTSIKQQKSFAAQSKLTAKQKQLQERYANNKQKYNDELRKLYEREGVNPTSGCLTSLLPFPIMLGIYRSVIAPLSNTLHCASDAVNQATAYISKIPGVLYTNAAGDFYSQLNIIHNFDALRDNLTMFSQKDLAKIESFSRGFRFFGIDLLGTPKGSAFTTFLWVIPVLSLVTGIAFQVYTLWYQKKTTGQSQQMGCMLVMMVVFPLISLYWAYTMPAAVGFYWVVSNVTSFAQSIITNMFFSNNQLTAMAEAQHAVTLELAEASVRPLPASAQQEIAEKLTASTQAGLQRQQQKKAAKAKKPAAPGGNKKKKGGSGPADPSAYIGTKK